MKLKYQQGGGLIYTPFIPGSLQSTATSGGNDNSGSDEPKIDALDKEILALMKGADLLPSDIQEIYSALISFQRSTQHLSDYDSGTSAYRTVMPKMLRIMNMIDVAKHNKDYWNGKMTEMRQHDAGSEVALDSYGRMWVQDLESKELKRIAPTDFDREKYNPVSNSMLMYMRERDLGFGDSIIDDTGMSLTGMGDVREEMDNIISKFGTIKSDDLQVQKFSDIAKDLQGMGVYKITNKYSKGDLYDFAGLLYSRLSRNAQHLIDANCAISGSDLHDYVLGIIRSETSLESSQNYEANLTKAALGGAGGSDGNDSLTHDTYAEHLNSGEGFNPARWTVIQPDNSDSALYVYSQDVGALLKDNKRFESANLSEVLQNADAVGSIVDASNISFGDQLLSLNDFSKVMYDESENMKRVYLPVYTDETGHMRIDFKAQQSIKSLQDYLDEHGEIAYPLIKEKLEEIPNAYLDEEHGIIKFKNEYPFLVLKGITSSDKVRLDTDSKYIRQMDRGEGDPRKDYKNIYNRVINSGYATGDTKQNNYDNGKAAGRNLYEGNIYLPLSGPLTAAGIYNYQYFGKSVYQDTTQKATNRQVRQGMQTNFDE